MFSFSMMFTFTMFDCKACILVHCILFHTSSLDEYYSPCICVSIYLCMLVSGRILHWFGADQVQNYGPMMICIVQP